MSVSDFGVDDFRALAAERRGHTALLIATHLSPGGIREVMPLIADELRLYGMNVMVGALYRGKNADLSNLPCEIMVDREQLATADYVKAFARLAMFLRATRPAAILTFMPAANILGALSASMMGVPIRIASHHQPAATQHPLLRRIDSWLGQLGTYSHVVAVSEAIRTSFVGYPRAYLDRISVIPNTIRPIAPRSDPLAVRRHFGLRADAVLMVVIGRLAQEKNLLNTLAGLSRVAGVQLALVGDGPLRGAIERYIAEMHLEGKVLLLGQVDRQVVADILFAADVFVQLSHFEACSLALLEAIYAEKAIIVSDIPSQREALTVSDGSFAGLLCEPNDIDGIASAISAVATNERLRRELAAKATRLKRALDPMRMGKDYALLLAAPNRDSFH